MSSQRPLISIALCTFNGANFLREQLESALNQTYDNFEIVIVDDGSTDGTLQIIEKFASVDKRIRYYKNSERLNLNKNFEKAMELCQGEYVCPCDQDDIWANNKLECLLQNIGSNNLIFSNSTYIDCTGNSLNRNLSDDYAHQNFNTPLAFIFVNAIPGHTMMIQKHVIKAAMPFPLSVFYDHWLAFVSLSDGEIKYVPETLQFYRQHSSNTVGAKGFTARKKTTKDQSKIRQEAIINLEMKLNYLKPATHSHKIAKAILDTYRSNNIVNRIRRVWIFIENRETLLLSKKKRPFKKISYCLKMYSRIIGSSPFRL